MPETTEKASGNQARQQKSHHRYKHLGAASCKIFGTIHKMDKERAKTNGQEGKKVDDDAQGLTFERWQRQIICVVDGGEFLKTKSVYAIFPGCLEHSQVIGNSILLAKRDKTELHVIWLDLANAYGSVPHYLIRMAFDFFNFPSKVGEIIMKYFISAFMKFIFKDYTTKWQALEIVIMMCCVIFPLLFVLALELILRGAVNTSKRLMKNEHLTLPTFRAFMDDIILVPSKIATDGLLQRYNDLFTWARMKAKSKKSRSLPLVGGSVREIHFKIGVVVVVRSQQSGRSR